MSESLHCVNHPKVETYLRCNKCGQPICARCAVGTPVGYRCKQCINAQQKVFYTGFRPVYYLVAAVVTLPLSFIAGGLLSLLGWYTIFLGPVAGTGIAELVRLAIGRRRGKYVWLVVCGSIVIGALPVVLLPLLAMVGLSLLAGNSGGILGSMLAGAWSALWPIVYMVTAASAAYWRLRPGRRV